jgi:ketosteroid isomerase-like protein
MTLRNRMALACVFGLSLTALSACNKADEVTVLEQPAKEAPDPAKAAESIKQAQAARIAALNKRDVDGAVSVYAPNATLVIPNAGPLADLPSIRANYASLLGDDSVTMVVTPSETWVSAGADFAVTTAKISLTSTNPDNPVSIQSTSQSVWQRQPDGLWKIISEYNVALPAAEAVPASDTPEDINGQVATVPAG